MRVAGRAVVVAVAVAFGGTLAPAAAPPALASDPDPSLEPWTEPIEPGNGQPIAPFEVDDVGPLNVLDEPPPVTPNAPAATALDHARACEPQSKFGIATAEEVMAGRLTIPPFKTVTIDPERDGNVDWYANPFTHRTWVLYYRGGDWVQPLIDRYLQGVADAEAYRARAKAYVRDWLRDLPIEQRNASTLICVARAFPGEAWIESAIPPQVDHLAATWSGPWNHGMFEDLMLLRIGCGYPSTAWGGKPLSWRERARLRILSALEPGGVGPAIDAQGASNEQSTAYTSLVYSLWGRAARRLTQCGYTVPAKMSDRIALMPTFIAHSIQPNGRYAQIGDTYRATNPPLLPGTPAEYPVTVGASGTPPAETVKIYSAGYVFGRSGWGATRPVQSESFYTLRFGRGRQIHGHDDHTALTWYARGRELLVDSGHVGYEGSSYREYLKSAAAHNVLTMPGVALNASAATPLRRWALRAGGAFYEVADTAYAGLPRTRSVFVAHAPDIAVVFDRASGARQYQQLWHLDPSFDAVVHGRSYATATARDGTTKLWLFQVPLPGQVLPSGSTQVVRGQNHPLQGWVSHEPLKRIPAPVVTMSRLGRSAAMLTVIVPAHPSRSVGHQLTTRADGWYSLKVRIGATVTEFHVSPGGYIRRV